MTIAATPSSPSRTARSARSAQVVEWAQDENRPHDSSPPVIPRPEARRFPISPPQLTLLVACAVSIFFFINFYSKSLDAYKINQRAVAARLVNAKLEARIKVWQQKVAYLSTDSYLETAAREKLDLIKAGDHPIVVLPSDIEVATVASPPPPAENRHPFPQLGHATDWLVLFFGNR